MIFDDINRVKVGFARLRWHTVQLRLSFVFIEELSTRLDMSSTLDEWWNITSASKQVLLGELVTHDVGHGALLIWRQLRTAPALAKPVLDYCVRLLHGEKVNILVALTDWAWAGDCNFTVNCGHVVGASPGCSILTSYFCKWLIHATWRSNGVGNGRHRWRLVVIRRHQHAFFHGLQWVPVIYRSFVFERWVTERVHIGFSWCNFLVTSLGDQLRMRLHSIQLRLRNWAFVLKKRLW